MTLYCKRQNFVFELNPCGDHFHLEGVGLVNPTLIPFKGFQRCEELGDGFSCTHQRFLIDQEVYWFSGNFPQPSFRTIEDAETFIEGKINRWHRIKAGKEAADKVMKAWVQAAEHEIEFMDKLEKAREDHGNVYDFLVTEDDEYTDEEEIEERIDDLDEYTNFHAHAIADLEDDIEKQEALTTAHTERLDGHFGHIKMLNKEIEGLKERLERLEEGQPRRAKK